MIRQIAILFAALLFVGTHSLRAAEPEWFKKLRADYAREVKSPKDQPPQPPLKARLPAEDYGYGEYKFAWNGASIVWDDHNSEGLFLGGHNGGLPFGSPGMWAVTEKLEWRKLEFIEPALNARKELLRYRQLAREAETLSRRYFHAALPPDETARIVRDEPLKRLELILADCLRLRNSIYDELDPQPKKFSVQSAQLLSRAIAELVKASDAFKRGQLDAAIIKHCFHAQWLLDEAAAALAGEPPPRENASAIFVPQNAYSRIVLFGGSHHDYMTNETWIYDCARRQWRQIWSEQAPTARMNAKLSLRGNDQIVLVGGETVLNKMVYQKGEMPVPAGEWVFDLNTNRWTGENGAPSGTRIYRSIVPAYDPTWYDAAGPGDKAATEKWLAELKPNLWTALPKQPAAAPERDWGTAAFDPDRDQIYRWTGGHCADPASQPSTYHPGTNRWSIPFIPDIIASRKGMTFSGRPDCANHTYLHYAYDPVSKRLICPSQGGTGIYNPDLGDFEFSVDQPFNRKIYETCAVGTPLGVIVWAENGKFWRFVYDEGRWREFPVSGVKVRPVCDGSAICYDAKRDCLWIASFREYQKPSGKVWKCDLKSGEISELEPAGVETIGKAKGFNGEIRESVYVPTLDLVLYNNFVNGRQVAYDPTKNRWVTLGIPKNLERLGSVSDTLTWDPKRKLVWNLNAYQAIYVLKLDSQALDVAEK